MDRNDPEFGTERRPRLHFTREQFDDYWIALLARIRRHEIADRIISGELNNPLISYQQTNAVSLRQLRVPRISTDSIMQDPAAAYSTFTHTLANALQSADSSFD